MTFVVCFGSNLTWPWSAAPAGGHIEFVSVIPLVGLLLAKHRSHSVAFKRQGFLLNLRARAGLALREGVPIDAMEAQIRHSGSERVPPQSPCKLARPSPVKILNLLCYLVFRLRRCVVVMEPASSC
jgi:hypothetical protein